MKKVLFTLLVVILFSTINISCTPQALTEEDEIEILNVDPANDGTIDDEDEEEPIQD